MTEQEIFNTIKNFKQLFEKDYFIEIDNKYYTGDDIFEVVEHILSNEDYTCDSYNLNGIESATRNLNSISQKTILSHILQNMEFWMNKNTIYNQKYGRSY